MRPNRLPPLNALRAFNAAARHMSFQKAAEELFVTPAALSYQIRQLENHLGIKLFHRLNRAVALTDEGHLIAPGIHDAFERMTQALSRLTQKRAENVLVVSAGPAFTAKWLTPRLYRFIAQHPEIDARISASVMKSDLESEGIDIALRFGGGSYPGCRAFKLMDEYVTPLCAPSLLKGDNALTTPQALAHHTLIHDDAHMGVFFLPEWRHWLEAAGVDYIDPESSVLHFNVADHAIDAAIAGAGVVLGRVVLAQGDIDAGRLIAPFDLRLKADYAFYAVSLEERADKPIAKAFRDWLLCEVAGSHKTSPPGPAV